jgi:hypothetical protein
LNNIAPLKFLLLPLCFINKKKDFAEHDELADPSRGISKMLPSERVVPRVGWSESSIVIA